MQDYKTPCYIIDEKMFCDTLALIRKSFFRVRNLTLGYSVKTNHNRALMLLAKEQGMLSEVVSDDEYISSMAHGYKAEEIIFNGPQKSEEMLIFALQNGSIVNLDNFEEIAVIKRNLKYLQPYKLKIGLRVNFDLESLCPNETTAKQEVSRFGFCLENKDLQIAIYYLRQMGIEPRGLHMHYSTISRSTKVFRTLASMGANLLKEFTIHNAFLDIGGGFFYAPEAFMRARPNFSDYASAIYDGIDEHINLDDIELILEPGVSLVSQVVDYHTRVINVRKMRDASIATFDGSRMHIDPFMTHRKPLFQLHASGEENVPIQILAGATCMENDRFLKLSGDKECRVGDLLEIRSIGGYTMGFNSCFINNPPYIYRKSDMELLRDKSTNFMEEL